MAKKPAAPADKPVWIHPDSLWNDYGGQPPIFQQGSQPDPREPVPAEDAPSEG